MTTSTLKRPGNFLWSLSDLGIVWVVTMSAIEFHHQYLHNPAVHMFFQSQGIFLF